jgi:hypothetical protein
MDLKEFLNDEKKHKEVLLKASVLGAFDQSVNYLMSEIKAMNKLEEEELAIIRYNINKFFKPDFNSK